jgi:cystathionine beta-lyase
MTAAHLPNPTAGSLRATGHLKWSIGGPDTLAASVAEMDFGVPPPVASALHRAIGDGLLGYLPPQLEQETAAACAQWQRDEYGWDVAAQDVRLVPDVIRALHIAIAHFSRPGSPVIVPVPAYMPFLTVPRLLGRKIITVPMTRADGRHCHDLDGLGRAFRAGGHLLLLSSPQNPLGHVPERDELLGICRVVDSYGGRVFADEIHAPLTYPGHRHVPYASVSATAAGHAMTSTSASKAWNLAGLKCAQVILSDETDRERWNRLDRLMTDGVSTLGAVAGIAAYRHGRPWLESVLAQLDRNRLLLGELVRDWLPRVRFAPPEGTYLAWLDMRDTPLPPDGLAAFLAEHAGTTVVDGVDCGALGRGFIRLNFATAEPIVSDIAHRLAAAVTGGDRTGNGQM